MKEYKQIDDLDEELIKELNEYKSYFDDFDGKSLDPQQRMACVLNDCDLEIIAGAGTGKTQTLVAKTSHLIENKNIKPEEILCLSFSNACVNDLEDRLNHPIETRTIHSLGLSIINQYEDIDVFDEYQFNGVFKDYLKTASPKQLFDLEDYCETYLTNFRTREKLKEIESDEEKLNYLISNTYIVKDLKQFVELYKGKDYGISDLGAFKKACKDDLEGNLLIAKHMSFLNIADSLFRHYERFLSRNNLIDFNDMINKAIRYIEEYGFEEDYKYIFVDEYQDMSYKNFQLLKAIKDKTNAHLVVVGDDWQSIYGFRDSDLKLFRDFDKYFPNAKRVFIEQTHRNPQQLIDVAGKFIMKNDSQYRKSLKSDSSIDKPIKIVYHSLSLEKENNGIYNLIYNLSQDNEVMILGRHKRDIDEFLKETDLVKKGRGRNYKTITDKYENVENVEFRTIHKAKGLEADYAIIIQVIDDYLGFPNKIDPSYFMKFIQGWDKDDKYDEERRLFYVALTRAKKGVYIFTIDSRESEYVDELINDGSSNLEIIYTDKRDTFSHLKEFDKAPKPKEIRRSLRNLEDELSQMEKETGEGIDKSIIEKSEIDKSEIEKTEIDKSEIEKTEIDEREIEKKRKLKNIGNSLIKSKDYDEAIDFYKKLITNIYFINDYYPYRKLVEVYSKKKESANVILAIEEFFKSERYCRNSQLLWFKLKFKRACKDTDTDFKVFEKYLNYFNEHGLKNKSKENDPAPIAARIQKKKLMPEKEFEELSKQNELKYNYKFANKYETSEKALYYYEQLWMQKGFKKNLTAYKHLCSLYEDTVQYDKVIEVAEDYFCSDAKRTAGSPDWFRKKIKIAESQLKRTENINNSDTLEINTKRTNRNSLEHSVSSSKTNTITVARNNFSKLLSSSVGDKISVKNKGQTVKLEILSIYNPEGIYEYLDENVKINISNDNFHIVESLGIGGCLIIKHKNVSGKISLRVIKV